MEGIDEDVLVEDQRLGEQFPHESPVVLYRLRKEVYSGTYSKGTSEKWNL